MFQSSHNRGKIPSYPMKFNMAIEVKMKGMIIIYPMKRLVYVGRG